MKKIIEILEKAIDDIKMYELKHAVYYENYPAEEKLKKEIIKIREAIGILKFYERITGEEK